MYPFIVAARVTPGGASLAQYCCTLWPLWITIGGQASPIPFTKVRMVEVSPCSPQTIWLAEIHFCARTNSSLDTFYSPVWSLDQICSGEVMFRWARTFSYSSNHFFTFISFVHIAWVLDRFLAFFTIIFGCLLIKYFAHFQPAFLDFVLNPLILFIEAYCHASCLTI